MDSLRVKTTCQSYYRRDPRNALPMLFLSLFVVSDTQCGGEDAEGREGEEGKEQRKAHLWKGLGTEPRSAVSCLYPGALARKHCACLGVIMPDR